MAALTLCLLATVAVTVHGDAEADAVVPHVVPQYGYTPAPAHYSPHPIYQETPVYDATVTPFVHHAVPVAHSGHGVAHHGGLHHQSVVQHHTVPAAHHPVHHAIHDIHPAVPAVHHPVHPVHHPAPYHEPKHEDYAPPGCSIDNPHPWCLEDKEYPAYEIEHALQYHYEGVQSIYKDVLANTDNSVDRLHEVVQETYLCPSVTGYIMPLRAVNTHGKWRVVVNGVKAHYETLTQTARIEECTTPGDACPLVPACYDTHCLQKNIYHRFLVYDPYDQYFPFAIETFQLPSACACYNGAYLEPPHLRK